MFSPNSLGYLQPLGSEKTNEKNKNKNKSKQKRKHKLNNQTFSLESRNLLVVCDRYQVVALTTYSPVGTKTMLVLRWHSHSGDPLWGCWWLAGVVMWVTIPSSSSGSSWTLNFNSSFQEECKLNEVSQHHLDKKNVVVVHVFLPSLSILLTSEMAFFQITTDRRERMLQQKQGFTFDWCFYI